MSKTELEIKKILKDLKTLIVFFNDEEICELKSILEKREVNSFFAMMRKKLNEREDRNV